MKITYYGHACFGIEINGNHLLFDPFITPNSLATNIDIEKIPADFIFVSHGHADHIADAVVIAKRTNALVISNFEIINWLSNQGVKNTHPMNIGGARKFDFGTVKSVLAVHSSELPDGTFGGNPGGFIIESAGQRFYFAGDTGLNYDMKLIGDYTPLDFAFLPIGDNFTMGIDDAVIASDFIKCKNIIGMHFDTFPSIVIDKKDAFKKFEQAGVKFTLPIIGESFSI